MNSKKEDLLTNKELDCIIGGVMSRDSDDDITNINKVNGCKCFFDNTPTALANTNNALECRCICFWNSSTGNKTDITNF
jgi:bacteriocin-like protein